MEAITADILEPFIGATESALPDATVIYDRCYLIRYLDKAINKVPRRGVQAHPDLKGSRNALLKNEHNRTKKQDEIFKVVQETNLQVSNVWRLREEFKGILNADSSPKRRRVFNSGSPVLRRRP